MSHTPSYGIIFLIRELCFPQSPFTSKFPEEQRRGLALHERLKDPRTAF